MKEFKGEQIAEEQLESLLDKLVYEEPQLNDFSELQKEQCLCAECMNLKMF